MILNKYIYLPLYLLIVLSLTACGGGGSSNDNVDEDDNIEMNDDMMSDDDSTNNDDEDSDDDTVVIIDLDAPSSWSLGGRSFSAGTVVDTIEVQNVGIIQVNTGGAVFSSEISIAYTLTGTGSYFISGSQDSVFEENEVYPNRIGILAQELDPSSSFGVALYQTIEDSGFVNVTVDGAGKYHFDIPSNSPISLVNLVQSDGVNTVDFSMRNVFDFR